MESRVPEVGEAGSHGRCTRRGAQVSCSTFRNWVQGLKFSYASLKLR